MNIINRIAAMLTDDPNVYVEDDMASVTPDKPMSGSEVPAKPMDTTSSDASKIVNDQLAAKKREEAEEKKRKQALVAPEMKQANTNNDKIRHSMMDGTKGAKTAQDQMTGVDSNLTSIKSIIQNIAKNL